tara:strand:- start:69 stop:932 length:864 start_codon:yes stop_codon:yes gene_type:complete
MRIKTILLSFYPVILFCNSFTVDSKIDKEIAYIGDIIKWTVIVKNHDKRKFNFPSLSDQNESISVIKQQIIYYNNDPIGIELELTAWDTGKFKTPDFSFDIMKNNEVDYSFELDPIDFEIVSILTTIDQAGFRDIKGPVPVKNIFPFKEIFYVFLLLVLMVAIVQVWRRRISSQYEKINYDILEDPYERASRRIKELDSSVLTKEYYSTLSHVLREYIETKYFIRMLEMTTEEIENKIEIFHFEKENSIKIINFLKKSDQVKYARLTPIPEKMVQDKKEIEDIIQII